MIRLFFLLVLSVALSSPGEERLIVPKGADPDVLFDGESYFLSYTAPDTRSLPILRSVDGLNFLPLTVYDPGKVDGDFNYYHVWAPDLSVRNGKYILLFSAIRTPKGQSGKSTRDFHEDGMGVTVFYAEADDRLLFTKPKHFPAGKGPGTAQSFDGAKALPQKNAELVMRIDPDLYVDEENARIFYTWFSKGNHISSVHLPGFDEVVTHVHPDGENDERIAEAACVFKRGPFFYLIFSHGHFQSQYGLSYFMADSLEHLTPEGSARLPLAAPRLGEKGEVVENIGHCSVVPSGEGHLVFYHKGSWTTGKKSSNRRFERNIYCSPLRFNPDGTIVPLN